jgi:hypothetical protein
MNSTFQKGGVEEPSYPQLDLSGKLIIKVCLMSMIPSALWKVLHVLNSSYKIVINPGRTDSSRR